MHTPPANKQDYGALLTQKMVEARTILIAKPVDKELMEKVTAQLLVLSTSIRTRSSRST